MAVDKHNLIEHEGNTWLKSNKHVVYLHSNYWKTELHRMHNHIIQVASGCIIISFK